MTIALCLDAGDLKSYAGGLTWKDTSGLKSDVTAGGSTDPVFHGDIGRLSAGERWRFSGSGRFTAAANPTVIEQFHKNSAVGTIIAWVKLASAVTQGFIGTNAADATGTKIGFALRTTGGGLLQWFVTNGVPGLAASISGPAVTTGQWIMVSVAINEATPLTTLGADTTFGTSAVAYTTPSAAAATHVFQVGAAGNNTGSLASGSEMGGMLIFDVALTQAQITEIYNESKGRRGL